jgi:HSP20 family protein
MNNFFDSFPYLQQMNEQFRSIFGDDFVKSLMSSMQSQGWMNGGQAQPWAMPQGRTDGTRPNQPQAGDSNHEGAARDGEQGPPMFNPFAGQAQAPLSFPLVDILEMRHELVLVVDVPGLERASDVRISVHTDRVVIKGELQRSTNRTREFTVLQGERKVGQFERTVLLPVRVRKQHAKAVYQQGLLEVRLLKEGKTPESDGTIIDIDFA